MQAYQKLKMVVVYSKEDIITTSNGDDNIVAGNSKWSGWDEGGIDQ